MEVEITAQVQASEANTVGIWSTQPFQTYGCSACHVEGIVL